jgi:hypothetical protein
MPRSYEIRKVPCIWAEDKEGKLVLWEVFPKTEWARQNGYWNWGLKGRPAPVRAHLCEEDKAFVEEWQRTHSAEEGHVIEDKDRHPWRWCSFFGCTNVPLIVQNIFWAGPPKGVSFADMCRLHVSKPRPEEPYRIVHKEKWWRFQTLEDALAHARGLAKKSRGEVVIERLERDEDGPGWLRDRLVKPKGAVLEWQPGQWLETRQTVA